MIHNMSVCEVHNFFVICKMTYLSCLPSLFLHLVQTFYTLSYGWHKLIFAQNNLVPDLLTQTRVENLPYDSDIKSVKYHILRVYQHISI